MNTNARLSKKTTACLASSFEYLRKSERLALLEFWFAFIDGVLCGLEAEGIVAKEQARKIIDQRDRVYGERCGELMKNEIKNPTAL